MPETVKLVFFSDGQSLQCLFLIRIYIALFILCLVVEAISEFTLEAVILTVKDLDLNIESQREPTYDGVFGLVHLAGVDQSLCQIL